MESPSLCEPGVKYFVGCSIKECRKIKDKYINFFYNLVLLVLLVGGIGGVLLYRYKGRMTPEEIVLNNKQKRDYIMNKLKKFSNMKEQSQFITDLPSWNNPECEAMNRGR